MIQFIEVTDHDGDAVAIVSLRAIHRILRDPRDGCAVLEFNNDRPRFWCKESYEQVRAALQTSKASSTAMQRSEEPIS